MTTKPGKKPKVLISILALSIVQSSYSWANQDFYREFLGASGIITVSGEQADEHHAQVSSIQIAHDQYRELRILNPDTGNTEILEFSDPSLRVTYSLPFHGHFLKLQIKRREKTGLRTADLVLASDDSHYIPIRNHFRKYQHFHQSVDFSGVAVCRMPDSALINKPALDPAIDPFLDKPLNVATRCLDSSCQRPPFLSEYKTILKGLTEVVASRDSSSSNGNGNSGKFLACLDQHKLSHFSGEMKKNFNESLKVPEEPAVICDSKNNGDRGEFSEEGNLIYFRKPWAYGGSTEPESDSASYYADTFFHESLHKAGIEDEDIVHDTVSCCGMEKAVDGSAACARLDKQVEATNLRNSRLIASMDKLVGFRDFWVKVQQTSDEQRVNTLYDDFFETLKSSRADGGSHFSTCIKLSGKSQGDCLQDFVSETDAKISQYFDSECPARFKDKSRSGQNSLCQSLKADALNIVNTNVSNVCDPAKINALERSCLFASNVEKEEKLAKARTEGDLLDAPEALPNDPREYERKKARDAFLTSYSKQIPALETAYNQIKEKFKDERTQSMFSSMLSFVGQNTNQLQPDYSTCIAIGESKTNCAAKIRDAFLYGKHGLAHFFRRVCPVSFTVNQNTSTPCEEIGKKIIATFEDSFSGGCKTADSSKQIGAPGIDLTCFFAAIDEGKYNLAHYDELVKEKKLINSDGRPMTNAAFQEAKEAAANASKGVGQQVKSVHIADQNNKRIARAASGAYRSPASEQGPVYAFDPSRDFESQLKNELRQQPTPVKKVLQDASRVISDMTVPSAEAETGDTSSLMVKTPASITPIGSAIAGDLESTRAINVGIVDPLSVIGRGTRGRNGDSGAAKNQGQNGNNDRARASTDDRSVAGSDSSSGRSPASASSASKNAKAAASNGSSGAKNTKVSANVQNADRQGSDSHESLQTRQKHLLEFFKNKPRQALTQLKTGALSSDLVYDLIQAKDDLGHEHGSKTPKIKIWYNSSSGIFMGLPEL